MYMLGWPLWCKRMLDPSLIRIRLKSYPSSIQCVRVGVGGSWGWEPGRQEQRGQEVEVLRGWETGEKFITDNTFLSFIDALEYL